MQPELHRIAVLVKTASPGKEQCESVDLKPWTLDILFSYTLLLPMEAFALHLKEEHEKLQFLIN